MLIGLKLNSKSTFDFSRKSQQNEKKVVMGISKILLPIASAVFSLKIFAHLRLKQNISILEGFIFF